MKPIINDIPIFDANIGIYNCIFKTSSQINQYTLYIKDLDGNIIYSYINIGYTNKFNIPEKVLTNDRKYLLQIETQESNNISYISNPMMITCIKTPNFRLDIPSINNEYLLESNTIKIGVQYIQTENSIIEALNEYHIEILDDKKNCIEKYDVKYNEEKTEINNLSNNSTYYLVAYGKTVHGMELISNAVKLTTNFVPCKDRSILTGKNDFHNACIRLNSKIDGVTYALKKPVDINNGINLTNDNSLTYNNINCHSDFSLVIKYKPDTNKNVTFFSANNGKIKINYRINESGIPYFEFITSLNSLIIDKDYNGNYFSSMNADILYTIILKRINNVLALSIKEQEE